MSAKRAKDVAVGETIKFDGPRVPTPGVDHLPRLTPFGEVRNPRRVSVVSRVTEVEPLADGRLCLHTEAKVVAVVAPDKRILVG